MSLTRKKLNKKGVAIIALLIVAIMIASYIIPSIVNASSELTTSNNTLLVKDSAGNTVNISEPTNAKSIKSINGRGANGVTYESVNMQNLTRTSDAKYSFSFKYSKDSYMTFWKKSETPGVTTYSRTNEYGKIEDYSFLPSNDNQSGNFGVYVYNAGVYLDSAAKSHYVNLKLTFSWESWKVNGSNQYPYIGVRTHSRGTGEYGLFCSFSNMSYATNIEIFEGDPATNGTPLDLNMNIALWDMDDRQFFGVGKFNGEGQSGLSHVNKVQCTSNSNVFVDDTPNSRYNNYLWFYALATEDGEHNNIIEDSARIELDNIHSFSFVTGSKHDPCSYNYGDRYYYESSYYLARRYDDEKAQLVENIRTYALSTTELWPPAMVGYFINLAYYPYATTTPIERIDDVNQYSTTNNEIGKAENYTYKVYHYLPYAIQGQYLSSYQFSAPIPNADTYKNAKVYQVNGLSNGKDILVDVTDKFTINKSGSTVTATAKSENLTKGEFYNNVYLLKLNVVEKKINEEHDDLQNGLLDNKYSINHKSVVKEKSANTAITLQDKETNQVTTAYHEIRIPITKVWNDNSNNNGLRPDKVTYKVKDGEGNVVKTGEISNDGTNSRSVNTDFLPLKDAEENVIMYTIEEDEINSYNNTVNYTRDNNNRITNVTITNNIVESVKINTRVDGNGGTITGSDQDPYERVVKGQNSKYDITITPQNGYQIKSITINNVEQQLPTNVKVPYTLSKFTNMQEDKLVVVKFEPIPKTTGIVNYYLKGTNQKIRESRNLSDLTIGSQLNAETYKEDITHYTYDSADPSRITVNENPDNNVLNLYYTLNKYGYTVEYYYDGVKDNNETESGTAEFGEEINDYEDKSKVIYKLEKTENVPLTITDNPSNNVMKIYYIMNENERNYGYSIEYYYDNVKDDSATVTGESKYESIISEYTDKNKDGFIFDKVENKPLTITKDPSKNIMKVYYVSDATIVTRYIDKETGEEIADRETEKKKIGDNYNTEKKDIKDYSYVSDSGNTSGTVKDKETEVIYYYEPVREIIIRYVDKQTGEEISERNINNGKTGETIDITSQKKDINGYTLIEVPAEKEATYEKNPQTFTYYYAKNSKIIIKYVDEDTGKEIATEVDMTGYVGKPFDITGSEKNINDYILVQTPKALTGNYTDQTQVFTYYYRKNPGLAKTEIPKTGINPAVLTTIGLVMLLIVGNGIRVYSGYKKEEKKSIKK